MQEISPKFNFLLFILILSKFNEYHVKVNSITQINIGYNMEKLFNNP